MSDDISRVKLCEDLNRESLHLNQHLEKMTEEMENISVKLSWMAYDLVVLRSGPDPHESLNNLENEFLQCKAVICGPEDGQDEEFHPSDENYSMEFEGNALNSSEQRSTAGLDYISKELDLMSECMDQLEVKTQLLQCNLTVCFTHPEKMVRFLTDVETISVAGQSSGNGRLQMFK